MVMQRHAMVYVYLTVYLLVRVPISKVIHPLLYWFCVFFLCFLFFPGTVWKTSPWRWSLLPNKSLYIYIYPPKIHQQIAKHKLIWMFYAWCVQISYPFQAIFLKSFLPTFWPELTMLFKWWFLDKLQLKRLGGYSHPPTSTAITAANYGF